MGPNLPLLPALLGALLVLGCSKRDAPSGEGSASAEAQAPQPAAPVNAGATAEDKGHAEPAEPPKSEILATSRGSLFVISQVSDLAAFKSRLSSNETAFKEAGLVGELLSVEVAAPHRVIGHYFVEDLDKAEAYLNSEAGLALLDQPGAPDSSLMWMTDNALLSAPSAPPTESFSLLSKLKVSHPKVFLAGAKAALPALKKQGLLGLGVHQTQRDPTTLVVHLLAASPDILSTLYSGEAFAKVRKDAGESTSSHTLVAADQRKSAP